VAEQRYQAVMAVIVDGLSVSQVAEKVGVSRQSCTRGWRAMSARAWRGSRIVRIGRRCPDQMPAEVEVVLLELRRSRPYWVRGGWFTRWPNDDWREGGADRRVHHGDVDDGTRSAGRSSFGSSVDVRAPFF
jgi:hypothetical protein